MDPELIKLAQDQMSRMSPAELARIQQQMMSNPDLVRMASESMKSMKPDDLKSAAEQLKYTRPEDMAAIGEKMANSSPEEIAQMRARLDAQISYQINAADMLKKQGNELHSRGNYMDALQKYSLAKKNLKDNPSSKARTLSLACSLNMLSCYLKTRQYRECIKEGTEVLGKDSENVKALYRRGQAYKELGQLEAAVSDLSKAHTVSPDDETITEVLRDAKDRLMAEHSCNASRPFVIEEVTEAEETSPDIRENSNSDISVSEAQETSSHTINQSDVIEKAPSTNTEYIEALQKDPEAIRTFQNFVSHADPESIAAMNGGKVEGISPNMIKTASNMIGKMSPEELQRMLQMASSFQGENTFLQGGSLDSGFRPGQVPPNMSPDMLKMASDMMANMPAEELQNMFQMASSLQGKDSASTAAVSHSNGLGSDGAHETVRGNDTGETSSYRELQSSGRASQPSFLNPPADLQEQMKAQMKDPAMRQMFTSMIKNMSPEMMANMGEQFGVKLSREDAERAQQAMSSLSPDTLDKMMRWADRAQRGMQVATKTKNLILGKTGMVLAICMLILAVILHRLGFIGS